MLYIRLYTGQQIRVEKQTIKVKTIDWETTPTVDGFVELEVTTVEGSKRTKRTMTLQMREDPLILDCYATLCATKISGPADALQVQLAIHSEVMLDIEFP